jgi:hypothetical protein
MEHQKLWIRLRHISYAKGLPAEVHLVIEAVSALGEPTHPKENATKFVNECGVLIRVHIPIITQEWHEPKKVKGASFVTDAEKDDLWTRLSSKFTLLTLATAAEIEAFKLKVKKWSQRWPNNSITTRKSYTITISRRRHLQNLLAH